MNAMVATLLQLVNTIDLKFEKKLNKPYLPLNIKIAPAFSHWSYKVITNLNGYCNHPRQVDYIIAFR